MSVRDLIPWGRDTSSSQAPAVYREEDRNSLLSLHREVNRLFDDVFRSFDRNLPAFDSLASFGRWWPSVEITETEKEIRITAEVPGVEEKDIELVLDDGVLTLRGEKRSETEDKDKQFSERFYGRFERRIPVGREIVEDEINARFRNGVLSLVLPKTEKAQSKVKRIAITS
ncbi:Hsp20/alpha crystallin family protein [Ochrobactrum sp. A-1]|uniref:Hsp20/alpha crystallin family protein n=1 Tax=Ochrobactrum sp. A-1 TaxID=2920940 RepID=UPI0018AA4F17|nr:MULTISPECIES: Hsp20/alpha crystallin family protein [unclassified Ochrobactrum]MCH4538708.1 Hsp20/alpha crystallin family protein [Ochrobactrum sp. A-1]